jgi:uncharacterized protein (TIGR02118 family)
MIKVVEFFSRRADLAPEAFLAHWRDRHTQVVLGIAGLRRYVQNPVIGLAGVPAWEFDGVVEVWFDSLQVMRDNGRSDYWPVVVEDEKRFIDRDSRQLLLAESNEPPAIVPGPKLMLLVAKAPEVDVTHFQHVLGEAVGLLGAAQGLRDLDCDLPIPSSYEKPRAIAGDAVLSLRFASWRDAQAAVAEGIFEPVRRISARLRCLAVAERVVRQ